MNDARFMNFKSAADAAFSELDHKSRTQALVVPAPDQKWRVIYSCNTSALPRLEQRTWAKMWESISLLRGDAREEFMRERLEQLVSERHTLALRALHDIEFNNDQLIRGNKGIGSPSQKSEYVADHTGYGKGGENFEHDDKGADMNYSGVHDDVYNAIKEHEDWQVGYDYT
jgi:hypothetical protein